MGIQRYRVEFKDILERTILPEGISIEERNERLFPLSKHIFEHIPSKLFRYRDCSEMNFDAFNEDKLFAVTSDKFNDPYDCLFRYDKERLRNSIKMGMTTDFVYTLREFFLIRLYLLIMFLRVLPFMPKLKATMSRLIFSVKKLIMNLISTFSIKHSS